MNLQWGTDPLSPYTCFIGEPTVAALFVPTADLAYCKKTFGDDVHLDIDDVTSALRSKSVHAHRLIPVLAGDRRVDTKKPGSRAHYPQVLPLKALGSAAMVYKLLPNATISPRILSRPLHEYPWVLPDFEANADDSLAAFQSQALSRESSFACIASFESGIHTIRPMRSSVSWRCHPATPFTLQPHYFATLWRHRRVMKFGGLSAILGALV